MEIRLHGTAKESIVDGKGFRYAIFEQGCRAACPGCHNPESQPLDGGYLADTGALIAEFTANPLLQGITLSGGEPFLQAEACLALARAAHARRLDVWTFTGFVFDEIMEREEFLPLLQESDILVDGPYIESLRAHDLPFRGSSNQRLIDVAKSLAAGRVIDFAMP